MVLDTVSIHLEGRSGLTSEGKVPNTMAADVGDGFQNGFTNTAYVANVDGDFASDVPGATAIDSAASSPYRTSSKHDDVVPAVFLNGNGVVSGSETEPDTGSGGYCCWKPRCLQFLATGRSFVFFCSLLSLTEAGLTIGYISSVVTSIERNFNFSSTLTGFVVSCYDIGTLLVVITSYYGGRAASNRPKWIAWSAWVITLGACIVPMSHFVTGNYAVTSQGNTSDSLVCTVNPEVSPTESGEECSSSRSQEGETAALGFLIPGMLLIGAGSTSMFTLGTTYIDDYVRKSEVPILLAIFFCTTVVGPGIGFVVGFLVLRLYVDFNIAPPGELTASDPDWLGAWWLGFFICAAAIAVTAVPVYAFPPRLPKPGSGKAAASTDGDDRKSSNSRDNTQVTMTFSQVSLKKIPRAIWNLLKNPVYMMVNIASAVEFSIVTGFVRFSPKFIEYQFNLSASTANLVTGTLVPVGAVGVVIGGIILNRVKRDLMTTINVLCIFTVTSGCLYAFVFIPGACPTMSLAGVTVPYIFSDSNWHEPPSPHDVNLTSSCNALCRCQEWDYHPVCGSNGVTYFSACHAGCVTQQDTSVGFEDHRKLVNYTNCSCIDHFIPKVPKNSSASPINNALRSRLQSQFQNKGVEVYHYGQTFTFTGQSIEGAITGQCVPKCNTLALFTGLLLLVVCVTSIVQMPALMTVLRSVKKEERPFALGLQFLIIRVLGYIPAPIYYGATIDSACQLWQQTCSDRSGLCLEYDTETYFYSYLGLSTGLKLISVTMAIFCWIFVRRKYGRDFSVDEEEEGPDADHRDDQGSVRAVGRSSASLTTQLDDFQDDRGQSSSNGIAVISSFNMADAELQKREPQMMDTVFS